jgi:hypothetical protein
MDESSPIRGNRIPNVLRVYVGVHVQYLFLKMMSLARETSFLEFRDHILLYEVRSYTYLVCVSI